VLVTTYIGSGYINDLKLSKLVVSVKDRDYDIEVDDYRGIPIVVDTVLVDTESTVTV